MKKLGKHLAITMAVATLFATTAYASDTDTVTVTSENPTAETSMIMDHGQRGPKLDLDEDQQAVVDSMKADGATREEIAEYLTSIGIELPEARDGQRGPKLDLDEDQQAVVDSMKADGATREEIAEYLTSIGIELPVKPDMSQEGPMEARPGTGDRSQMSPRMQDGGQATSENTAFGRR